MNDSIDLKLPADDVVARTMRERRTIHAFQSAAVDDSLVLQAIELACWAPNHHHTEPWQFVLCGEETQKAIIEINCKLVAEKKGEAAAEAKRERWSAVPGWLLVTAKRDADPIRDQENYAATCCAIQNLSLWLWSKSVGVKWTTGAVTRSAAFRSLFDLDSQNSEVVGLLWYGYPEAVPSAKRQPLGNVVRRLP